MIGYIYKSEVAGKVYIGKTIGKLNDRIRTHINHAFVKKLNTKICQALRTLSPKDAYDSFCVVEKIEKEDYDSLEKSLCDKENYYMVKYNSIFPNGYNIYKSYPQKKRNCKTQPPRESVMRKIECLETGIIFNSLADASREYNINISAIYHCLKGTTNTAAGCHWKYVDEEYHKCTRPEGGKNRKSQSKPVMCKETGVIYPSTGEAERQTGICRSNIANCANGRLLSAGGYKWGYVVNGNPIFPERRDMNKTRVMCVDTGDVFESITDCAKSLGEEKPGSLQSSIQLGCKHKGRKYIRI